jgi:hypothetical protein
MNPNPYAIFFMLFVLAAAAMPAAAQDPAPADEPRYRIELIVLMHLEHSEEARRMRWLEDYSVALDLLTPVPADEAGAAEATPAGARDSAPAGTDPSGATAPDPAGGEAPGPDDPALTEDPLGGVVHLPEPGPQMQDAWRRLRLSGPFRPLQFLAWEQRASAPFPTLRVHDGEAVLVQDPWAAERAEREAQAGPAGQPQAATSRDLASGGPAVAEELPPPIHYYRLDGTAQLTRSRFLHLALNIEWREPLFGLDVPGAPPRAERAPLRGQTRQSAGDAALAPAPDAFDVYRLQQSRQVRLRRMEYFDGPVLGVLAWISPVDESAGEGAETVDEVDMAWTE